MKKLFRFFSFFCLCLLATGCVIEAPELSDDDDPPISCGLDESVCGANEICAVVDPCGSACADVGPDIACAAVCVEVLGCVTPLAQDETCDPYTNHCGEGLDCIIDENAGCGPTDCYADGCAECPPIFTCQAPELPRTCDELDCGPGFRCELEVQEGCGYADPEVQRACEAGPGQVAVCVPESPRTCDELDCGPGFRCELVFDGCGYSEPDCEALPWQTAVCVPEQVIDECDPQLAGECAWNEQCKADFGQCIPSRCNGDTCTDDCRITFTCQPITCDDVLCPEGSHCESIQVDHLCDSEEGCDAPEYVELICVPDNDHIIGDSCDETQCLFGYRCVETHVYLPCDGPGCDEPVDVHVSCELDDGPVPPPHPVERCDTDSDCGEGFECRYDAAAMCEPSFCEGDFCTQDCADVFTCQPIEGPLPPTTVPGPPSEPSECQPDADDCEAGFSCQMDHDAPCEPSFCDENACTDDCRVVFTCQEEEIELLYD